MKTINPVVKMVVKMVASVALVLLAHPAWAQCDRPKAIPVEQWTVMSIDDQRVECARAKAPAMPVRPGPQATREDIDRAIAKAAKAAQDAQVVKQRRSPKLVVIGALTALVGFGIAIPKGETYTVLDEEFCVTRYEIADGRCSTSARQQDVGLAMVAAGGVIMAIGAHKVAVAPSITRHVQGVSAKVSW